MSEERGKLGHRWHCSCAACSADFDSPLNARWGIDTTRQELYRLGWRQNPYTFLWFCPTCVADKKDALAR